MTRDKLNEVLIPGKEEALRFTKKHIIERLLSFDEREPDKTYGEWQQIAKWLHQSGEIKEEK